MSEIYWVGFVDADLNNLANYSSDPDMLVPAGAGTILTDADIVILPAPTPQPIQRQPSMQNVTVVASSYLDEYYDGFNQSLGTGLALILNGTGDYRRCRLAATCNETVAPYPYVEIVAQPSAGWQLGLSIGRSGQLPGMFQLRFSGDATGMTVTGSASLFSYQDSYPAILWGQSTGSVAFDNAFTLQIGPIDPATYPSGQGLVSSQAGRYSFLNGSVYLADVRSLSLSSVYLPGSIFDLTAVYRNQTVTGTTLQLNQSYWPTWSSPQTLQQFNLYTEIDSAAAASFTVLAGDAAEWTVRPVKVVVIQLSGQPSTVTVRNLNHQNNNMSLSVLQSDGLGNPATTGTINLEVVDSTRMLGTDGQTAVVAGQYLTLLNNAPVWSTPYLVLNAQQVTLQNGSVPYPNVQFANSSVFGGAARVESSGGFRFGTLTSTAPPNGLTVAGQIRAASLTSSGPLVTDADNTVLQLDQSLQHAGQVGNIRTLSLVGNGPVSQYQITGTGTVRNLQAGPLTPFQVDARSGPVDGGGNVGVRFRDISPYTFSICTTICSTCVPDTNTVSVTASFADQYLDKTGRESVSIPGGLTLTISPTQSTDTTVQYQVTCDAALQVLFGLSGIYESLPQTKSVTFPANTATATVPMSVFGTNIPAPNQTTTLTAQPIASGVVNNVIPASLIVLNQMVGAAFSWSPAAIDTLGLSVQSTLTLTLASPRLVSTSVTVSLSATVSGSATPTPILFSIPAGQTTAQAVVTVAANTVQPGLAEYVLPTAFSTALGGSLNRPLLELTNSTALNSPPDLNRLFATSSVTDNTVYGVRNSASTLVTLGRYVPGTGVFSFVPGAAQAMQGDPEPVGIRVTGSTFGSRTIQVWGLRPFVYTYSESTNTWVTTPLSVDSVVITATASSELSGIAYSSGVYMAVRYRQTETTSPTDIGTARLISGTDPAVWRTIASLKTSTASQPGVDCYRRVGMQYLASGYVRTVGQIPFAGSATYSAADTASQAPILPTSYLPDLANTGFFDNSTQYGYGCNLTYVKPTSTAWQAGSQLLAIGTNTTGLVVALANQGATSTSFINFANLYRLAVRSIFTVRGRQSAIGVNSGLRSAAIVSAAGPIIAVGYDEAFGYCLYRIDTPDASNFTFYRRVILPPPSGPILQLYNAFTLVDGNTAVVRFDSATNPNVVTVDTQNLSLFTAFTPQVTTASVLTTPPYVTLPIDQQAYVVEPGQGVLTLGSLSLDLTGGSFTTVPVELDISSESPSANITPSSYAPLNASTGVSQSVAVQINTDAYQSLPGGTVVGRLRFPGVLQNPVTNRYDTGIIRGFDYNGPDAYPNHLSRPYQVRTFRTDGFSPVRRILLAWYSQDCSDYWQAQSTTGVDMPFSDSYRLQYPRPGWGSQVTPYQKQSDRVYAAIFFSDVTNSTQQLRVLDKNGTQVASVTGFNQNLLTVTFPSVKIGYSIEIDGGTSPFSSSLPIETWTGMACDGFLIAANDFGIGQCNMAFLNRSTVTLVVTNLYFSFGSIGISFPGSSGVVGQPATLTVTDPETNTITDQHSTATDLTWSSGSLSCTNMASIFKRGSVLEIQTSGTIQDVSVTLISG